MRGPFTYMHPSARTKRPVCLNRGRSGEAEEAAGSLVATWSGRGAGGDGGVHAASGGPGGPPVERGVVGRRDAAGNDRARVGCGAWNRAAGSHMVRSAGSLWVR